MAKIKGPKPANRTRKPKIKPKNSSTGSTKGSGGERRRLIPENPNKLTESDINRVLNSKNPDASDFTSQQGFTAERAVYGEKKNAEKVQEQLVQARKAKPGSKEFEDISGQVGYKGNSKPELLNEIKQKGYGNLQEKFKRETGFVDKALYNKWPQKAAGVGITATLLSSVFGSNKGSMDNSQLYNPNGPSNGGM